MPKDIKSMKSEQSKKSKKQDEISRRKKEHAESDSDSDSDTSENSESEMDVHEYRKFLSKIFPSRDINKKVEKGEKLKKQLKKMKEEESSSDEDDEEDEEEETYKKKKAKANKKSSKKPSKKSSKKEKNSKDKKKNEDSDSEEEEEEEDDDDEEEEDMHKNKFNIILTVGGDDDDDDDEEWDEYDEDYIDSDEDTEDEDESVSSASSSEDEEDDEEDEDDDDEDDDEEEEAPKKKSSKSKEKDKKKETKTKKDKEKEKEKVKEKKEKEKNDKKEKSEKSEEESSTTSGNSENKISDDFILEKLKEIHSQNKDNKLLQDCLKVCEENMKVGKKKQEKKNKKQKDKNARIFKKILKDKNTNNDYNFFDSLLVEEQKKIIKELREINKLCRIEKPYRITLLESDIPPIFKGAAMKKINSLRYMEPGSGEYYKIKSWVDTFMRIPFGVNKSLPVNITDGVDSCHEFMDNAQKTLDAAVYGLNDAKMQIMQMLGQLVTNPAALGTAIAIQGPMGTGKTTLVKEGISKILNRPFAFIALGGATDSSFLEGHSYTYEGSTWGKIVQIIIDSKCMNPVIYFDELDKISDTPKGEEIAGILTHLTDTSQNSQFHDKYFSEIDFDLSKCLFIFSYNDESKVNPILRDRMYRIHTKGYDSKQKTVISNQYLLPKIREQVKFSQEDIVIPDDVINYIIENYCNKEDGVRNMKRCLEIIYTKLNLYRLMRPGSNLFEKEMALKVEFPIKVTRDIVDKLVKKEGRNDNYSLSAMYL
jgi:ATP-dependent Lon protease